MKLEETCKGKGTAIKMNETFGTFRDKTRGSCVPKKLQKKKDVSAVLLPRTLHIN